MFLFLGNNGLGNHHYTYILFVWYALQTFQVFNYLCPAHLNQAKQVMGGVIDIPSFMIIYGRENLHLLALLSNFRVQLKLNGFMVGIETIINKPVGSIPMAGREDYQLLKHYSDQRSSF